MLLYIVSYYISLEIALQLYNILNILLIACLVSIVLHSLSMCTLGGVRKQTKTFDVVTG